MKKMRFEGIVITIVTFIVAALLLISCITTVLYAGRYLVTFNNDFLGFASGLVVLQLVPITMEAIFFSLFNVDISHIFNNDIYMYTIFGVGLIFLLSIILGALPLLCHIIVAITSILIAICRAYITVKLTYWLLK